MVAADYNDSLKHKLLSILTFTAVVFCIVCTPKVKLRLPWLRKPKNQRGWRVELSRPVRLKVDYAIAPVLGVLLLLATGTLHIRGVWRGITGDGTARPWVVAVVFMTLAYLCLSLDHTGTLYAIALRAKKAAAGSGVKMCYVIYSLSAILTIFTSNDVVVITLTQMVSHLTRSLPNPDDALPLLYAEFFSANTWSMLLVIANPTNIIIGDTFRLNFMGYLAWMFLPTLVAGIIAILLLHFQFRGRMPDFRATDDGPEVTPLSAIPRPAIAAFASIWFVLCLIFLAISSYIPHLDIWIVTLFFAGTLVIVDVAIDIVDLLRARSRGNRSMHRLNTASSMAPTLPHLSSMESVLSNTDPIDSALPSPVARAGGDRGFGIHPMPPPTEETDHISTGTTPVPVSDGTHACTPRKRIAHAEPDVDVDVEEAPSPSRARSAPDNNLDTLDEDAVHVINMDEELERQAAAAAIRKASVGHYGITLHDIQSKKLPRRGSEMSITSTGTIDTTWLRAVKSIITSVTAHKPKIPKVDELKEATGMPVLARIVKPEEVLEPEPHVDNVGTRTKEIMNRMPWALAPFVLGMFIIVESLDESGWIKFAAKVAKSIVGDSVPAACYFFAFVSAICANFLNNQPMTILFARIIASPYYSVSPRALRASYYSLVIGSNLGAYITLVGSMAGIMWAKLLREQGIKMTYFRFVRTSLQVVPIVILVCATTFLVENFVHSS
eukprot:jgi/Chlat1/2046/Chrsp17S02523